ncbi:MAG: hypothetical protein Q8K36_03085 [Alphaproteobacteria bacterium]|nr:hypothetical protein [Alphaproteobacteria bacterium]
MTKMDQKKIIGKEVFFELMKSRADNIKTSANFLLKAKNIRGSGTLIEDHIKNLFTKMFSSRFRMTSGYIVSANEKDYSVSPEVDLIILDTLVPNIIFPQEELTGKSEFVPKEAVVGIFQIKKTLNIKTIKESFQNIHTTIETVNIIKDFDQHYNLGGHLSNEVYYKVPDERYREGRPTVSRIETNIFAAPILGVIGLEHSKSLEKKIKDNNLDIDIIFSFDGFLRATPYFASGGATNENDFVNFTLFEDNVISALGLLTYHLYRRTGTFFSVSDYYINKDLYAEINKK